MVRLPVEYLLRHPQWGVAPWKRACLESPNEDLQEQPKYALPEHSSEQLGVWLSHSGLAWNPQDLGLIPT